jgi:hypothetical protein
VRTAIILAIAVGVGAPPVADAGRPGEELYEQAKQLFLKHDYIAAAGKFYSLYELTPEPALLFNIAQSYRLGHACALAARYYHQFRDAVPNPPNRDKLERYITEMDACATHEAGATPPQVIHDTKVVHDTQIVRVPDPGRTKRIAGVALAAAGLVGLGAGAYLTYDVHQIQRDREALCPPGCIWGDVSTEASRLDTRGHRAEVAEAFAYGVGGAALIAGITLYVLGRNRDDESTLLAAPTHGGAMISTSWRF